MSSGNQTEPDISIQWHLQETEQTLTSLRLSFLIHGMRTTINSVLLHRAGVRNYEDMDMKLPLPFLCSWCWNCSWTVVSLVCVRSPSLVHTPRASLASLHQLLGNPQESGLCLDGSNFFNHALHPSLSRDRRWGLLCHSSTSLNRREIPPPIPRHPQSCYKATLGDGEVAWLRTPGLGS